MINRPAMSQVTTFMSEAQGVSPPLLLRADNRYIRSSAFWRSGLRGRRAKESRGGKQLFRFLLDRDGLACAVELNDTVTLGIMDMIAEDGGTDPCFVESFVKSFAAVKNIVTENERDGVFADEGVGDQKCLRDAFGLGLL